MAAALVGEKLGLTNAQIIDGIKSLTSVEGRMNIVDEGQPFTVIVDYAHAPDALEKVFDENYKYYTLYKFCAHTDSVKRNDMKRCIVCQNMCKRNAYYPRETAVTRKGKHSFAARTHDKIH